MKLNKNVEKQEFLLREGLLLMDNKFDIWSFVKLERSTNSVMARKVLDNGGLGEVEYQALAPLVPVEAFYAH
jgi:hypothetical protein